MPVVPYMPIYLILLFIFFLLPSANSLSFKLSGFNQDATNILYEGDAVLNVGAIEFNMINYINRVGWATYAERVHLWDKSSGKLSDFTTHFSFFIDNLDNSQYGHGLAFFLAPVGFQIPPNSGGGFLGLFNTTTSFSSQNQLVTVEFDSFPNPEWDPPTEHVGINSNNISSAVFVTWNASLHSRVTCNAWITYNSTTKILGVFWTYDVNPVFRENFLLSYHVDLMKVLPEWVTIGFSAATGQLVERHVLQSWEFSSSLEINETKRGNKVNTKLVVALVIPAAILIGGVILSVILWKRRKTEPALDMVNLTSTNNDFERGAGPKKFSFQELVSATNNFSKERKLGEGGFGGVYKGFLNDLGILVAVKKISRESKQGRKEYITEVKIISSLRHRNLVQLIGWCHEGVEFLLVYEFMPNRSLDYHLFSQLSFLTWTVRYKIALGLASALLYLHEEWEQCVVHRDIKSSNVMLDSSFNAKLGDFGLAKLMDHDLGPQTTGLAGTLGYLAPEYVRTGKASKQTDVFSFGVVALEIASGKKSTAKDGLVEWVWELYGKGSILEAVDERFVKDFDFKEVECLMIIGLWCAHPDHSLRPSIRQAIQVLKFEAQMPTLPSWMPLPLYHDPAPDQASSSDQMMTTTSLDVGR
ncbi:hypothetical protein GIB67_041350 [Kingdonia uniflora]|uniref:non-specific serine/threonine protein kinase n=1 Tax=Kingdonia uniflora TaxID=39325 RepID=A0A7J7NIS8_9MAGN|nr:hypothetical protein GIB67_041350 [Kingdonia uniflora]